MSIGSFWLARSETGKKRIYHVYEMLIALMAIILIVINAKSEGDNIKMLAFDSFFGLINTLIYFFFIAEYFIRLYAAENKLHFVRSNIIDLISIMPIGPVFPAIRLVRFLRFFYIFRPVSRIGEILQQFWSYAKKNDFHYMLMVTAALIVTASWLVARCEHMKAGDAIWWAIVTITTVGYGDISPKSLEGRCVAAVLMFFGIGLISSLTAHIASFLSRERNKHNYTWNAVRHIRNRLAHFDSLSEKDLNEIHAVLLALKKSSRHNEENAE